MIKRRETKVLMLLLFVCLLLMGCTSKKQSEDEKEHVILTVLAGQTAADAGIEDMIDDLIMEKYPYVTLDWETVDWGTEFDEMLRADFASGEVPDIIIGKAQDISAYHKTGNLAEFDGSLTSYIDEEVLSTLSIDDKVYGIPFNEDYMGVLYNKDILQKLNLSVPKTKEDLEEIVAACEKNNITPFACVGSNTEGISNCTMQFMINEVFQYDDNWGKEFWLGMTFMDQCEEMRNSFLSMHYMMSHSWNDVTKIQQYECDTRFAQGEALMYMTNTGELSRILQDSGNTDFGIFPYPNERGQSQLIRETNMTFMKSAQTQYSNLIDEILVTILTNQELNQEIAEFTQKESVLKKTEDIYPQSLREDIDYYIEKEKVIDSNVGYNQLSWNYMTEVADKQIEWLKGYTTLDKVLAYAELKRPDCGNFK